MRIGARGSILRPREGNTVQSGYAMIHERNGQPTEMEGWANCDSGGAVKYGWKGVEPVELPKRV